jgi:hypothetical protein
MLSTRRALPASRKDNTLWPAQAEATRADSRFKRSARRGHDGESSNVLNQAPTSGVTEGQYPMAGASESEASRSPIQIARPPEQWRSIEQWSRPGAHLQRYGRTIPFGWRRRKRSEPVIDSNPPPTGAMTEHPATASTRRTPPGVRQGQYHVAGAGGGEASRSLIPAVRPPGKWRRIERWFRPGAHLQRHGRTIPFGWRRRKRNEPIAGPNGPPTRARTENPAMFPTRRAIPASRKDNTLWPELSEAKRADSSSQRSARRRNGGE